jgi:hypothetical protein
MDGICEDFVENFDVADFTNVIVKQTAFTMKLSIEKTQRYKSKFFIYDRKETKYYKYIRNITWPFYDAYDSNIIFQDLILYSWNIISELTFYQL